jgi:anthraniloyl-CoA monooxygenase
LQQQTDLLAALWTYEAERAIEVLKIQNAARNSTEWFENVDRYTHLEPEQFAYRPPRLPPVGIHLSADQPAR